LDLFLGLSAWMLVYSLHVKHNASSVTSYSCTRCSTNRTGLIFPKK
jgi:hypothetical protein